MKISWAPKQRTGSTNGGPLNGKALARMKYSSTPMLMDWVDASLVKVGRLVSDSRHVADKEAAAILAEAETEAAALCQALNELINRRSSG